MTLASDALAVEANGVHKVFNIGRPNRIDALTDVQLQWRPVNSSR